jgi:hypothetical protein
MPTARWPTATRNESLTVEAPTQSMTFVKRTKPLPSQETLAKLLSYDPQKGFLVWLPRSPQDFLRPVTSAYAKQWNEKYAGNRAFCTPSNGYYVGTVLRVVCKAHRVIWKLVTGEEPSAIDHLNGDGQDNRWTNLRAASDLENQRNRRLNANNQSGTPGVCFARKTQKWQAQIRVKSKMLYLGQFHDKKDAVAARLAAEKAHEFHPNHGKR